MIEGGWSFIAPAYVVALVSLGALALVAFVRARHWAKRARELDQKK